MLVATVVLALCRIGQNTTSPDSACEEASTGTSQGEHRRSSLHPLRHLFPHIDSKVGGQGDTLQQGRPQNLFFATEDSKSYQPYGLRFDSFHARTTSCHEVSFALRRAHAKAYRLGQQQDRQPRNPPTYPCEPALRISTLHPNACPTVKCHESCTCNRKLYTNLRPLQCDTQSMSALVSHRSAYIHPSLTLWPEREISHHLHHFTVSGLTNGRTALGLEKRYLPSTVNLFCRTPDVLIGRRVDRPSYSVV